MASGAALSAKNMNNQKITNVGAPSAATDVARKAEADAAYNGAISRANHTGSQTASTISDFDAQVRTSRLDQLAVPTGSVNANGQKLVNQGDPTAAQDSATKNYVDNQLAGLATGQTLKGSVRVATSSNINLAAPGATIDNVTMVNGDIFLATAQTTGSQNGPYQFNGSGVAATRALNWDTSAEAVLGSYWIVREGSQQDAFALLSNDAVVTLGTTTSTFVFISVGGAAVGRYAANCPVTVAGGAWAASHNLNSTDVVAVVKRVASPFDAVDVYWETTDANTITVRPDIALAAGEYRIVVKY